MKTKKRAIQLACCTVLAVGAYWAIFHGEYTEDPVAVSEPTSPSYGALDESVSKNEKPVEPVSSAAAVSDSESTPIVVPEELPPAVIETRRMYQAHASLRTDEVDNPDSATNQRIKREMLLKALANVSNKTDNQ